MHNFSTLFGKERYMFRTYLLSIIRSLYTVFTATGICQTEILNMDKITSVAVRSVFVLLFFSEYFVIPYRHVGLISICLFCLLGMRMDIKSVRNMYSSLPNKFEKQCISLAFIIRMYHDPRSYECQILLTFLLSVYLT